MDQEPCTFLGYMNVCGRVVAEFKELYVYGANRGQTVLDRASCEERLKNLKGAGRPHDQTEYALQHWPE